MPVRDTPRATRFEILGAWLHVWTPPRGVYIPPVPWGKVAAGAGLLVVLGVVAAVTIAPAIDDAKDEGAAERERAVAARAEARRERIRVEQQARTGALAPAEPLAAVERAIGRDAAARFKADGTPATCETTAGTDPRARRAVFDCFATLRRIEGAAKQKGAQGTLAIPYRAVLDHEAGRYAFCKVNPRPGEAAIVGAKDDVPLPPPCRVDP
jgi:hypothetical protein